MITIRIKMLSFNNKVIIHRICKMNESFDLATIVSWYTMHNAINKFPSVIMNNSKFYKHNVEHLYLYALKK